MTSPARHEEQEPIGAMLASARQSLILEQVRLRGSARISDLSQQFGVSDMTVRRDIDALAERGSIERIHGGARVPAPLSHDEPGFEAKSKRQEVEKRSIALEASRLVSPGMVVGLSAGTTTFALATLLCEIPNLTVVTNSTAVAEMLHRRSARCSVIMTGGERTPSDALVGPIAVSALRQLHVDVLFLGVHGVDERAGLTTPNLLEAETNRVFIEAAGRLVVLADHTKWGTIGMSSMAKLQQVDTFITDAEVPEAAQQVIAEQVGVVIVAVSI